MGRNNRRGSTLIECVLALPLFLFALAMLLWWTARGASAMLSMYTVFIATRAASVATTPEDAALRAHGGALANFPAVPQQQLTPPWRVWHVPQPRARSAPHGDNPLL